MKIELNELVVGQLRVGLPRLATNSMVHAWLVPEAYRDNGLFVSVEQPGQAHEIPACDTRLVEYVGAVDLPADDGEALLAAKDRKREQINAACDEGLFALANTYPAGEVSSWPQQVKEADAIALDAEAPAPLLATIAQARGIALEDLAGRVHLKMQLYSNASGVLIGRRQHAEDALDAAQTLEEVEALEW